LLAEEPTSDDFGRRSVEIDWTQNALDRLTDIVCPQLDAVEDRLANVGLDEGDGDYD
jgi:hypothetical protein